MAVETPHFDLPFRFNSAGTAAVVVEQDSDKEIKNCVEAIVRYPVDYRDDLPEFGIDQQVFTSDPDGIDLDKIKVAVTEWEPRAETEITQRGLDATDIAIREVIVNLGVTNSG